MIKKKYILSWLSINTARITNELVENDKVISWYNQTQLF